MHRFIILHFTFCFLVLSGQEVSKPVPTAYFSVVFWGDSSIRSLQYSPWGNFTEGNSTKCSIRSVYGSLSGKCAYYGKNDIEFYRTDSKHGDLGEAELIGKLPFVGDPEKSQEFITLFYPADRNDNFKCVKVPFEKNEIAWGSFKVISQFKETLFILVQNKQITLEPGGNFILDTLEFENTNRIQMIVYRKINGKFEEMGGQDFVVNDTQRGILFITTKRKRMHIMPLVESNSPLELAVGYDTTPNVVDLLEDYNEQSNPPKTLQNF